MSVRNLEKYLPENTLPYLKKWFGDHFIHIKITKGRNSKLGDYRKLPDKSHQITVNSTLAPELFFFVLTHELAHLLAFDQFRPKRISPHGSEWKQTFREMLLESLDVYHPDLQRIIIKFSKSPKANFMSSEDLVRYFHVEENSDQIFIENLEIGDEFIYKAQKYLIEEKSKKRYLCKNFENGKRYFFKSLAKVEKI